MLTTHLHLVLRLRMKGSLPLHILYAFMALKPTTSVFVEVMLWIHLMLSTTAKPTNHWPQDYNIYVIPNRSFKLVVVFLKWNGKVRPKIGHEGPERGGSVVNAKPWPVFPPGKTRYPLIRGVGVAHSRSGRVRKISPPTGIRSRTFQPAAIHYTDWVTPASCKV